MIHESQTAPTIWRRKRVEAESGQSRSTLYRRIAERLWPRPVNVGPRAVGWPATEVAALNAARIAGRPDLEIRSLVETLEQARQPLRNDAPH